MIIKGFFKECFRYKVSGASIIVCLVLSMLAAYYGITIYKNVFFEYGDKVEYRYQSETYFKYMPHEQYRSIELSDDYKCNLKLLNYSVYADDMNETIIVDIIVASYDEMLPLISGRYITEDELKHGDRVVLLGREREKDTYEVNGEKYFKIFGEEYRVIGIIGTENSVLFDYKVLLYENCLGDYMQDSLELNTMYGYSMVLESNEADTGNVYDSYIKEHYESITEEGKSFNEGTAEPIYNEEQFCIIIYVFCFICIAVAIKFWMEQRTKEIQLCRAYGFTNAKIVKRIAVSLSCLCVLSLLISALLVIILNFVMKSVVDEYRLGFSAHIVIPYIMVFCIALICVCVMPVARMLKLSIAKILNDKE